MVFFFVCKGYMMVIMKVFRVSRRVGYVNKRDFEEV